MVPNAMPITANRPRNLPTSKADFGLFSGAAAVASALADCSASLVPASDTPEDMSEVTFDSLSEANLLICSFTKRPNLRYGDQKACRTLIGLSIILIIVASQSRPLRS